MNEEEKSDKKIITKQAFYFAKAIECITYIEEIKTAHSQYKSLKLKENHPTTTYDDDYIDL